MSLSILLPYDVASDRVGERLTVLTRPKYCLVHRTTDELDRLVQGSFWIVLMWLHLLLYDNQTFYPFIQIRSVVLPPKLPKARSLCDKRIPWARYDHAKVPCPLQHLPWIK